MPVCGLSEPLLTLTPRRVSSAGPNLHDSAQTPSPRAGTAQRTESEEFIKSVLPGRIFPKHHPLRSIPPPRLPEDPSPGPLSHKSNIFAGHPHRLKLNTKSARLIDSRERALKRSRVDADPSFGNTSLTNAQRALVSPKTPHFHNDAVSRSCSFEPMFETSWRLRRRHRGHPRVC
ncbi:hypothetical protein AOLI_G00248880 [Acnodon oligacanthus]